MITKDQEKEVIRVCGKNYEPSNVPALWRQKEAEKSEADQREADDLRQREIKNQVTERKIEGSAQSVSSSG